MRKTYLTLSCLTFAALLFMYVGCKKDDGNNPETTPKPCPTPTYPISGVWTGTYSVNGTNGSKSYSLSVLPDGTAIAKGEGNPGSFIYSVGTWTLTDSTFNATITTINFTPDVTQNISATFSNAGILKNGTWTDPYNTGTFSTLQRAN